MSERIPGAPDPAGGRAAFDQDIAGLRTDRDVGKFLDYLLHLVNILRIVRDTGAHEDMREHYRVGIEAAIATSQALLEEWDSGAT